MIFTICYTCERTRISKHKNLPFAFVHPQTKIKRKKKSKRRERYNQKKKVRKHERKSNVDGNQNKKINGKKRENVKDYKNKSRGKERQQKESRERKKKRGTEREFVTSDDEAPGPYITIPQYRFNKTKQHTHPSSYYRKREREEKDHQCTLKI